MATVIRKAEPNIEDVHIDKPLTNISIAYIQDTADFIADEVFPNVPVSKRSDKYYVYNKNDWLRDEAERRADASETTGSGYNLSNDDYSCEVWGFHKDIGQQERSNTDDPLDADRDATEFVTHKLLIRKERLFTENYLNADVWSNADSGGEDGGDGDFVYWDDDANSAPIEDVTERKRTIRRTTGFTPNVFVIGGEVWDVIRTHPDIVELVKYSREAINLSEDLVARALDVDKLVVAEGIYASNEEGAEETYEQIVGKHGLLAYANQRPTIRKPSAGYIFSWTGYGGRNAYGVTVGTFYMREKKADRVEGEMAFDMKQVGDDLGFFMEDLIS